LLKVTKGRDYTTVEGTMRHGQQDPSSKSSLIELIIQK